MKHALVLCGLFFAVGSRVVAQDGGEAYRVQYDHTGRRVVTHEVLGPAGPCNDCSTSPPMAAPKVPKLSPDLSAQLASMSDEQSISVVVSLPEDVVMPAFPPLRQDLPDSSQENMAIIKRRADLVARLETTRRVLNTEREKTLRDLGMRIRERFWISNSVLADATPRTIRAVAALPDIIHIELDQTNVKPPTTYQGRQDIRSDTIFNMASYNLTYWRIALLDTGMPMRADGTKLHALFSGLNNMAAYDCVNTTDSNCTVPGAGLTIDPTDDCYDHATHSASILVGTGSMSDTYRGVTAFPYIYGYKVYSQNGTGSNCGGTGFGLITQAAQRGFQAAVAAGAPIIVAEIQDYQGSALDTSANNAYYSGSAVIATAGNYSLETGVRSPAEARLAVGVGAVDAFSLAQQTYQSHGPEPDGRIKPEIQGPTNTTTASIVGCIDSTCTNTSSFGGTSGSNPYVGGAAALLGWWMNPSGTWVYPGYIYANLILFGNNFVDPVTNNTRGAGLLRIWPADGSMPGGWGYLYLDASTQYDYTFNIGSSGAFYDLTASLWWPEGATQTHNEVDISLIDPTGVVRATSNSATSVFQKARAAGLLALNNWTIRMTRQGGGAAGSQQVFYAFYYKQGTQWSD